MVAVADNVVVINTGSSRTLGFDMEPALNSEAITSITSVTPQTGLVKTGSASFVGTVVSQKFVAPVAEGSFFVDVIIVTATTADSVKRRFYVKAIDDF